MQTLRFPATPGRRAALEVVLLPAAYSAPEDFVEAGFVEAVRARGLDLDLSFVPLELSDVTDRTIVAAVLEELIAPAREHGTTVWLGGISLGGYLALCCAERAPGAIAGLALFAPYLGSYLITGEIARAGLKSWTCAAGDEADEERRIWRFLKHRKAAAAAASGTRPRGSLCRASPGPRRGARARGGRHRAGRARLADVAQTLGQFSGCPPCPPRLSLSHRDASRRARCCAPRWCCMSRRRRP